MNIKALHLLLSFIFIGFWEAIKRSSVATLLRTKTTFCTHAHIFIRCSDIITTLVLIENAAWLILVFPDTLYVCTPWGIPLWIGGYSSASMSSFSSTAGDAHVYSSRQLTLQCVNGFTLMSDAFPSAKQVASSILNLFLFTYSAASGSDGLRESFKRATMTGRDRFYGLTISIMVAIVA